MIFIIYFQMTQIESIIIIMCFLLNSTFVFIFIGFKRAFSHRQLIIFLLFFFFISFRQSMLVTFWFSFFLCLIDFFFLYVFSFWLCLLSWRNDIHFRCCRNIINFLIRFNEYIILFFFFLDFVTKKKKRHAHMYIQRWCW